MVMNYARPSVNLPCAVIRGAIVLSTRMAVSALVLFERPMGMPSFQKEVPCQNSMPLAASLTPSFPRWCSWMRIIWGGVGREANYTLISFGLVVPPFSPLTLREARVRAFSVIGEPVAGNRLADRSRKPIKVARCGLWACEEGTKYTIRGKVVASPKSRPWWVLWVRVACGSS